MFVPRVVVWSKIEQKTAEGELNELENELQHVKVVNDVFKNIRGFIFFYSDWFTRFDGK